MIGLVWNNLFLNPMLNGLLLLYRFLGHNYVLSIIAFTVIARLITLPLTRQQMRSTKAMSDLQPKLQELQKKYANDKEKLSQAQMELYREAGVNPLGGCLPLLIQMPFFIGVYQSIIQTLSDNPLQLINLSQRIYPSLPALSALVPLNSEFLWLDLVKPDPTYILPVLVAGTMWLYQKMMTSSTATTDPQQAAMTQSMAITMPLMFGFMATQFSSGLSIYFVVSNVVSMTFQYFTTGLGGLTNILPKQLIPARVMADDSTARSTVDKVTEENGKQRTKKKRRSSKRRK